MGGLQVLTNDTALAVISFHIQGRCLRKLGIFSLLARIHLLCSLEYKELQWD